MTAIQSSSLVKVYHKSKTPALKQISLTISRGQIFTLLGRNGAGKTTLFNSITGIYSPTSGRVMELWSTEPGIQLYSGNFLEGKVPRDAVYAFRTGFCLEPSHFPDSPNKPNFPSTVLNPGEWYSGKTVYRFSVRK